MNTVLEAEYVRNQVQHLQRLLGKKTVTRECIVPAFGNIDVFTELVAANRALFDNNNDRAWIFHTACEMGALAVVRFCYEQGVCEVEMDIIRALRFAAQYNRADVIDFLLDAEKERFPGLQCDSDSPLCIAAVHGRIESVQRLLADPRIDPCENDYEALNVAVRIDRADIVQCILNSPRCNNKNTIPESVLVKAVATKNTDVMRLLREAVGSNQYDAACLKVACDGNLYSMVDFFLRLEDGPTTFADPLVLLRLPAKYGHGHILELLLGDPRINVALFADRCAEYKKKNAELAIQNKELQKTIDELRAAATDHNIMRRSETAQAVHALVVYSERGSLVDLNRVLQWAEFTTGFPEDFTNAECVEIRDAVSKTISAGNTACLAALIQNARVAQAMSRV